LTGWRSHRLPADAGRIKEGYRGMHPDELFAAVRRRPFVPLRLHVSDGSAYDLRHPDSILVTRRSVILALPGDLDVIPERAVTIALVHVTRLEEIDGTPAGTTGS
jgi:hypothetical protein